MTKNGTYPHDIRPNSYFLPHHDVFKEDSSTTKLRVGFDDSSHINILTYIILCSQHRNFQQILWRSNPTDEISIYKLNTVTYGTTSAPYLAIRVLQQIAKDFKSDFPKASKVLISDSYVDDIISGAPSYEMLCCYIKMFVLY